MTNSLVIGAVRDLSGVLLISFSLLALAAGIVFFIWLAYNRSMHSTPLKVGLLHYTTKRLGTLAYATTGQLAVFIPLAILHSAAQAIEKALLPRCKRA